MSPEFEAGIREYLGFENKDIQRISGLFEIETLNKGEFFLKSEQYCNRLSYIVSGYIRIYQGHENKEVTQWIAYPNSFITELSGLVFNQRSRFNMQALTDCQIYSLPKSIYDRMGDFIPNWYQLEKLFMTKCFMMLENRVMSHLSMSAEERYLLFYNENKPLFNQVPLQYLASMLGMSPETFSRIRNKQLK